MAFGTKNHKKQKWVSDLGKYLMDMKEQYYRIGYNCSSAVSNTLLIDELSKRMEERDGNMLIGFFDDMTDCIHDNMNMLANTEIGFYVCSDDGYIEDDDCYNLLARTVLAAADEELGYGSPKSELIHWMKYMFMSA